jgi:hypothetical protein
VATDEKNQTLAGPSRPLGSVEIPQFYLPGADKGVYSPRLYGAATIQFGTKRQKIDETRRVAFLVPLDPQVKVVDWDSAKPTDVLPGELLQESQVKAEYLPLPADAMKVRTFTRWAKSFDRWLQRTQRLDLPGKSDQGETVSVGPKRGGVSVELVAIVWQLG